MVEATATLKALRGTGHGTAVQGVSWAPSRLPLLLSLRSLGPTGVTWAAPQLCIPYRPPAGSKAGADPEVPAGENIAVQPWPRAGVGVCVRLPSPTPPWAVYSLRLLGEGLGEGAPGAPRSPTQEYALDWLSSCPTSPDLQTTSQNKRPALRPWSQALLLGGSLD